MSDRVQFNILGWIIILFLSWCFTATAQAQGSKCSQIFQPKILAVSDNISLEFPTSEKDPYQLRGSNPKGLSAEEKTWVTKIAKETLKEAIALGLINNKTPLNLLFFKSEEGSGAFGPDTDSRRALYLSEATLSKHDSTILIHELGHVLTNLAGKSHFNSMFGIGEALADLSVFFLSKQTHIGSDDNRAISQRSLVDRRNVDFDGSRSAKSIASSNSEKHLTPLEYLGGELFSRIVIDIVNSRASKTHFDFKELIENLGQFVNHIGASLYQSEIANQLITDLFHFYSKGGPVNITVVKALADCYWALAASFGKELDTAAIQNILERRGIDLLILKKFSKIADEAKLTFNRKEHTKPLNKIGVLAFKDFKKSEINSESQALSLIKEIQNYIDDSVHAQIELDWSDSRIGIQLRESENKIVVTRGFISLENMTRDAFVLAILRSTYLVANVSKLVQSDYWSALKFNGFLASKGEAFLNKDGLPERNVRAIYFLLSFEQYFNPTQSAFDPYAQLPDEIKSSRVIFQKRWDAAIHGAFQRQ